MVTNNQRYQGKPLLRLLECFVLSCIGELTPADARLLLEMTPKLRAVYRKEGDWLKIVVDLMELPSGLPSQIRDLWNRNAELARTRGVTLTPQQFAEMFVDQNLV